MVRHELETSPEARPGSAIQSQRLLANALSIPAVRVVRGALYRLPGAPVRFGWPVVVEVDLTNLKQHQPVIVELGGFLEAMLIQVLAASQHQFATGNPWITIEALL